jgi:putative flippase GtrA
MSRLSQIVRFGLVGVLATLVHMGVSLSAHRWLDAPPLLANSLGWCVAVGCSMAGHALFTFRQALTPARMLRFTLVSFASIAFSSLLVYAGEHLSRLPANVYLVGAPLLTPVFTYLCHSLWTFSHPKPRAG